MNCLITINDYHNTDGNMEKAELTTSAQIYGNSDRYFIEYDEQSNELKGCHAVMEIEGEDSVSISRTGSYTTNMKISKNKRNLCCYTTPVGTITMGVNATRIISDFADDKLNELDFTYTLDIDNVLLNKNRIRITAKYKEEN